MAKIKKQQYTEITIEFADMDGVNQKLVFSPEEYSEFVHALQEAIQADITHDYFTDEVNIDTSYQGFTTVSRFMREEDENIELCFSNHPTIEVTYIDMDEVHQIVNNANQTT